MTGAAVEVLVNPGDHAGVPVGLVERAVRATLADGGLVAGEVSVTFVDDAAMQDLNGRYLGKDATTDVLAFSLGDDDAPLGDVYVGVDQARRQARDHGVSLDEELVRLAIHGTLHVLGHDHPDGPERLDSPMFARQEALVAGVMVDAPPPGAVG